MTTSNRPNLSGLNAAFDRLRLANAGLAKALLRNRRPAPTKPTLEGAPRLPLDVGRNTPAARAYVNDRRAGITHPDWRETRDPLDPRVPGARRRRWENRADRRTAGVGRPVWTSPRTARGLHPLSKRVLDLRAQVRVDEAYLETAGRTSDRPALSTRGRKRVEAHRDALQNRIDQLIEVGR